MLSEKDPPRLPEHGIPAAELIEQLRQMQRRDVAWREGRVWSLVYYAGEDHQRLLQDAYAQYFSSNFLNPLAFESVLTMEKDVVRMTVLLLHGDTNVVGTMSSGGTESILLAMYTYREWARQHRRQAKNPEVIVPQTVHPAFDKAAHLFGLRLCKVPVDASRRAIPADIERRINHNTILIVASAPGYANGILDPIPRLGLLAEKYKLPFHVDACIGGFMLPWVERMGATIEPWDFRVPGVTSVSTDVHKFGYSAKGASVILYRSMDYLKYQFFVTTDFPGGIYITPTILGSRPASAIAAAWAAMKHMGESGYLRLAQQLMDGTRRLRETLQSIPEVRIIGDPCMNIISFNTRNNNPDIFAVASQLEDKGWLVDRQQLPDSIHLTILPTNLDVLEHYIMDLREAIQFVREHPESVGEGSAPLYGLMARIPLRGMIERNVRKLFEEMYGAENPGQRESSNLTAGRHVPAVFTSSPRWMRLLNKLLSFWKR